MSPDTVAGWLPIAARNAGYGITISDAQRRLMWANESFTRMTGYDIGEVVGRRVSELIYFEATNADTVRQVRAAFAAVRGVRFEIPRAQQEWRVLVGHRRAAAAGDARGTLRGWACIQTDVTAEVLKREATRRDQKRVLTMIEGGNIGTWELDSTTNRVEANAVFLASIGHPPQEQELNLEWLRSLYHADDRDASARGIQGSLRDVRICIGHSTACAQRKAPGNGF